MTTDDDMVGVDAIYGRLLPTTTVDKSGMMRVIMLPQAEDANVKPTRLPTGSTKVMAMIVARRDTMNQEKSKIQTELLSTGAVRMWGREHITA